MSNNPTKTQPLTEPMARRCPMCGKAEVHDYRPFCSNRCADLDLGHWFNESYAIPALEPPDDFDEDGR